MLQMSQMENPRCSAKIDRMRLRRETNLPVDCQNFSSSGFQSEIQAGLSLLISAFLSGGVGGLGPPRRVSFAKRVPRYVTEKSATLGLFQGDQLHALQAS